MSLIYYKNCPLCGAAGIHLSLKAQDYTVSKETFEIWHCDACTGRFTQNIPTSGQIGRYYAAEEYISHTETKAGLVNRLYHSVRKITMRSKQNWVKSAANLKQGKLLDIGCGTGAFLHYMQQIGWSVTGLEPDAGARARAKELYNVAAQPVENLFSLETGQYDAITMWHVLEHVHEIHAYLQHLPVLLKPGGALLIAVPNYTSLDAQHYGPFWAAYDVPRHLYHFSPPSMEMLLQQYNIQVVKKHPMVFDAFYVSLLSEKYKTGHSGLVGGFIQGLRSYRKGLKKVDRCSSIVYECKVVNDNA
ncbi:class I SAM-dependent methyltransferase [Chitinophaga parva]|uniref:Class I SAM-dependent methyltransferase n=1 Tax=Chitinophaga parva TaxID=2169414 RepID=A0A2T7BBE4_9BACT|nr:class I SAM-dependent methyltransferase [Chitinophaga parva]PUZ21697.1 class I SAM-dependent methyltransferase [Chitinophaga parva]